MPLAAVLAADMERIRHSRRYRKWLATAGAADTSIQGSRGRERHLCAGGARVQHRVAEAIAAGSVHRAEAAGAAAHKIRTKYRCQRAGRTRPRNIRCLREDHRVSAVSETEEHLVDALPELVNPRTGRVHTTFQQAVAATGRLGSSDPNLQNIPIRTREGRDIRSAFLPGLTEWRLLSADYSQIELRGLPRISLLQDDVAVCGVLARGTIFTRRSRRKYSACHSMTLRQKCDVARRP